MSDINFAKGMLVIPFHLREEGAASPSKLSKSTTHEEQHMNQFDEIFKGGKKSAGPKPVAAQKRASRPGNDDDATAGKGKHGAKAPSPARGGLSQGVRESKEMGGRPKKDPSTRKSFNYTVETDFHLVDYVMDPEPTELKKDE